MLSNTNLTISNAIILSSGLFSSVYMMSISLKFLSKPIDSYKNNYSMYNYLYVLNGFIFIGSSFIFINCCCKAINYIK